MILCFFVHIYFLASCCNWLQFVLNAFEAKESIVEVLWTISVVLL